MPTPSQIDALPDYTDAQLLKLYRYALTMGWGGSTRSIDGQSVTFPDVNKLMDLIERLERRIADDDENGNGNGGVALTVFGRPQ